MNIFDTNIKKIIEKDVIYNIKENNYDEAINELTKVFDLLYSNIPDNKRISYGRYYTIKVLSDFLYDIFKEKNFKVYEISKKLFEFETDDFRIKALPLGLLSLFGIEKFENAKKTIPIFLQAASHKQWATRECVQSFFRRYIKKYPDEIKPFLIECTKSSSPYIRRFVSESLRPVTSNRWINSNPDYSISILRLLFNEKNAYPRTSVGNNLSDLTRKQPELVYKLVKELVDSGDKNSYWIAYRACRNLVKKEPIRVMDLLRVDEYKYKKRIHKRSDY